MATVITEVGNNYTSDFTFQQIDYFDFNLWFSPEERHYKWLILGSRWNRLVNPTLFCAILFAREQLLHNNFITDYVEHCCHWLFLYKYLCVVRKKRRADWEQIGCRSKCTWKWQFAFPVISRQVELRLKSRNHMVPLSITPPPNLTPPPPTHPPHQESHPACCRCWHISKFLSRRAWKFPKYQIEISCKKVFCGSFFVFLRRESFGGTCL